MLKTGAKIGPYQTYSFYRPIISFQIFKNTSKSPWPFYFQIVKYCSTRTWVNEIQWSCFSNWGSDKHLFESLSCNFFIQTSTNCKQTINWVFYRNVNSNYIHVDYFLKCKWLNPKHLYQNINKIFCTGRTLPIIDQIMF